jgi:hypothetical protein
MLVGQQTVGTLHTLGCGRVCRIKYRRVEPDSLIVVRIWISSWCMSHCTSLSSQMRLNICPTSNLVTQTEFYWTEQLSADVTAASDKLSIDSLPGYITYWRVLTNAKFSYLLLSITRCQYSGVQYVSLSQIHKTVKADSHT